VERIPRIAVALACALALAGVASRPARAAVPPDFFGVNAQYLYNAFGTGPSGWQGSMDKMAQGGLQTVRNDAPWTLVEPDAPQPGREPRYDFSSIDPMVAAYAQRRLRWLPVIDFLPSWAGSIQGDAFSVPARLDRLAAYGQALARRYGRGGAFWRAHPELPAVPVTRYELLNEPNSRTFMHPQDRAPERYADAYLATRAAIRAADPAARLVIGGLALDDPSIGVMSEHTFLERMYRHRPDLAGKVDAIGLHPYQASVDDVYERIRRVRTTLDRLAGPQLPIDVTEVGWTTTWTSEAARAAGLARLADELPRSDCNIEALYPYTWITDERDTSNPEHWFGIFNRDGTPKPSGSAYLSTVRRMRATSGRQRSVGICHPPTALPQARGPRLILRARRSHRRTRRVVAAARCPDGCRLRVELLRRTAGSSRLHVRITARRFLSFSSRRRRIVLRVPRRTRVVKLRALARSRGGGLTVRVRRVRLRRAHR
jgi:polysaccharide biosynthesis protein PslG